jgi:hypothetical protein
MQQDVRVLFFQLATVAAVLGIFPLPCQAQTEKIIYSFSGGADGSTPQGGVILDANISRKRSSAQLSRIGNALVRVPRPCLCGFCRDRAGMLTFPPIRTLGPIDSRYGVLYRDSNLGVRSKNSTHTSE